MTEPKNPIPDSGDPVPFSCLGTTRAREMKARDAAPGTYMVVYTPDSFKKHPRTDSYFDDMQDPRARRPKAYRSNSGVSFSSISTASSCPSPESPSSPLRYISSSVHSGLSPDSTYPAEEEEEEEEEEQIVFRDIAYRLEIAKTFASSPDPGSPTLPFAKDAELVVHYKDVVSKTLVPTLMDDSADEREDPILIEAKTFPPLRHALCAITSLSLAVKGQRQYEDALHHYRQALESSGNLTVDPHSDSVLYLHYVLMLYDTCYETQTPSEEHNDINKSIWARHFKILFSLVVKRYEEGIKTPAWMLRQLLELDIQACLTGNAFGGFARAFLNQDLSALFDDVFSIDTHTRQDYSQSNNQALTAVLRLWSGTLHRMARIARLAIRLRSQTTASETYGAALVEKQRLAVDRYYSDLCAFWTREYPSFLPFASAELPLGTKRLFDSALLNYSVSSIYLQTSMFSGQKQQDNSSSSVPVSCKVILKIVTTYGDGDAPPCQNLVFPTFLAGYANTDWNSKAQALGIIKKLEQYSLGGNASRAHQLLTDLHKVQQCAADVDWIEFGKQHGLSIINFDL